MLEKLMRTAVSAAYAGGVIIRDHFSSGRFVVSQKPDTSFSTDVDVYSERSIGLILKRAYPEHRIVGEEGVFDDDVQSDFTWTIDPLDGTDNFVMGIPYFSISISLHINGFTVAGVVYNPITDDLFTAIRGSGATLNDFPLNVGKKGDERLASVCLIPDFDTKGLDWMFKLGAACYRNARRVLDTWAPSLDWCMVAAGKADAVIVVAKGNIEPDAGMLILCEANGMVTNLWDKRLADHNGSCILGSRSPGIHDAILEIIAHSRS